MPEYKIGTSPRADNSTMPWVWVKKKSHAHLHLMVIICIKFHCNPLKTVEEVRVTNSYVSVMPEYKIGLSPRADNSAMPWVGLKKMSCTSTPYGDHLHEVSLESLENSRRSLRDKNRGMKNQQTARQTDRPTARQTDRSTNTVSPIYPPKLRFVWV